MKKVLKGFSITIVILLLIGGGCLYAFKYFSHVNNGQVEIFEGANVRQITGLLQDYHIIRNGDVFYYYIKIKEKYDEKRHIPFSINFKHGEYKINNGNFDSLIKDLNGSPLYKGPSHILTIPEGSTVDSIANILDKDKIFTKANFINYIQDPNTYANFKQKYSWLPDYNAQKRFQFEGYLQANTYHLDNKPSMEEVVDMMLKQTDGWYQRNSGLVKNTGYSFDQVLTIASMVEKESKLSTDRPKVAQVLYNRLKKNMKLELDTTAMYANGVHKVFMTNTDIKTNSPYNTYVIANLPLGPICSPSKEAFVGTLFPSGNSFIALYFYARPNGQTFYANTIAEHEKNKQLYEHEWIELEKQQTVKK